MLGKKSSDMFEARDLSSRFGKGFGEIAAREILYSGYVG